MTLPGSQDAPAGEIAALAARGEALRQAASLDGADPGPLLQAALTELGAALHALTDVAGQEPEGQPGEPSSAVHAERRLLQAVFQQAPVPLFLLGQDGAVRRANTAACRLLGAGSGYPTGKLFTAFVDLPSRAAVQTELAAAVRTGEPRQLRCALLTKDGQAHCAITARPVSTRSDTGQVIVLADPGPAAATPAAGDQAEETGEPDSESAEIIRAMSRRLDVMTAASRILLENITYSEQVAVQQYARLLATELGAWVIIDVERGQRLRRQMVTGPRTQEDDELARTVAAIDPPPGSAPAQVHESGSALLIAHTEDPAVLGTGPDGTPLLMVLGSTSLMCVPLSDGERGYGVLTLAAQRGHGHFGLADIGLVEELGEHLALAIRIDRLYRQRTEVADALQASLLPRQVRQVPGTEVAAAHVPATTDAEVSADFYDVYPARDGWGIAIGDVCGRGEDAAAVSAVARHALRAFAHLDADPAAVLRNTNEIMLAEEFGGRFVTAAVAHLHWQDQALHVELASAGHPAALLVRLDGRIRALDGGGLPLGIFADAEPAIQRFALEPGEVLFLFTDGLTSACAPDMVDFENRLQDELAVLAGKPPAAVVAGVRELVLEFCQNQFRDDITMVAMQADPTGP